MKRRQVLFSGLAALGASAAFVPARVAAQQTQGIAPIGIAVADGPLGRIVARVYPARGRRNYLMMMRTPRGDTWRSIRLPASLRSSLRTIIAADRVSAAVQFESGESRAYEVSFDRAGEAFGFRIEGPGGAHIGQGTGDAPDDEPGGGGGGTQALGLLGFLLAVFAMVTGLAGLAMLTDTPVRLRMRCPDPCPDVDFQIGEEALDNEGDGFMADPSCEGLPPRLC